jgi:ADP-ribosyl-[dinitrogen reductase] hydrolase
MTRRLTTAQLDRAAGVLLGLACGDALGAPFEFGPPLGRSVPVAMNGGGDLGWEPGEWTDDTSMAIAIAEPAAAGADLRSEGARDQIAAHWSRWAAEAKDVGNLTRAVLDSASRAARSRGEVEPAASDLTASADERHARIGRSGGNGSLMRTAPIALAYLHDPETLVLAAQEISAMTHHDPEAAEACVLWCLAIRHAVLHGTLDVRAGLERLPGGVPPAGPLSWMRPRPVGRPTSNPTAGSCRPCRAPGPQSPTPFPQITIPRLRPRGPRICGVLWRRPSAVAATPTPSPP